MKLLYTERKTRVAVCLAGVIAAFGIFGACATTAWAVPSSGESAYGNVVVRDAAVDGAQVGSLTEGQEVTITDETTGSDGKVWYAVTFDRNGTERSGWVRSDLIEVTEEETVTEEADTATADETAEATTTEQTDTEQADAEAAAAANTTGVRVALTNGFVDLVNVPDDVAATVSDRFVKSACTLTEGSVLGYQLATADELVSNDAILTNYYYLYGTNEIGESGWYVYDASQGSLQKSNLEMSYTLTDTDEDAEDTSAQVETSDVVRMVIAVLALICVLLLILVIVFSIRYRRLRAVLEREEETERRKARNKRPIKNDIVPEDLDDDSEWEDEYAWEPEAVPEPDEQTEPETEWQAESEMEKQARPEASPVQAEDPIDIMDLDDMDDADYEAMLGQYLDEHLDSADDEDDDDLEFL